jgi:uncharacterized membrane protein YkoI
MNAKRTLVLGVAIAALAISSRGADPQRVDASQLPSAVRNTLNATHEPDPIRKIERRVVGGRVVYDIEFERKNAPNPRLRIAENGDLLSEAVGPIVTAIDGAPVPTSEFGEPVTPAAPKLALRDLPAAVQETARREANGREIADIDRETWNGRPVYEIEFRQRGLNARIYVADDGTLVRDERPRHSLKSLFMGMQLDQTPAAVQQTVRRIAGDREIADVDKKGPRTAGAAYYRVEIRDERGTQELRIAEDGRVLYDSRATAKPQ